MAAILIGVVARHAVRHEAPVGVAHHVDLLGVDGVPALDLGDDVAQVRRVVDGDVVEVAAGVVGVPELVAGLVDGAVGHGVDEAARVGLGDDVEVVLLQGGGGGVAVEHHHEGHRRALLVGAGHVDRHGPVAADGPAVRVRVPAADAAVRPDGAGRRSRRGRGGAPAAGGGGGVADAEPRRAGKEGEERRQRGEEKQARVVHGSWSIGKARPGGERGGSTGSLQRRDATAWICYAPRMSYVVLARKWRPQSFADLVGQEHVSTTIGNAIAQNRVAHAFLFTGVRGVGKTTSARILAKALDCVNGPTATPCQVCPQCKEITVGSDVDVQEIDGASYNGVDEVRRLQETLPYRPQRDRFKIFIVDEVHMLSNAAWNAFLKTLEEPPPHVKFIFATTEVHKVPVTILSRCQRYDFKLISALAIAARLRFVLDHEGIPADDAALKIVAREAAGSMRDAMSLLDQVIAWLGPGEKLSADGVAKVLGVADRVVLHRLAEALITGDAAAAVRHRRRPGAAGLRPAAHRARLPLPFARSRHRQGRGRARPPARPRRRGARRRAAARRPRRRRRPDAPAPGLLQGLRRHRPQRPAARRPGDGAGAPGAPPAAAPHRRAAAPPDRSGAPPRRRWRSERRRGPARRRSRTGRAASAGPSSPSRRAR